MRVACLVFVCGSLGQLLFFVALFSDYPEAATSNLTCDLSHLDLTRFNQIQTDWLCDQLTHWKKAVRSKERPVFQLTPKQLAYLDFLEKCDPLECVEFRFPSDEEERERSDERARTGKKRLFGSDWRCQHKNIAWRPKFCNVTPTDPFRQHRTKRQLGKNSLGLATRYLVALRNEDAGVSLAYWDSTLDQPLPDARDSVLWMDQFLGNGNGHVTSGPFAHWPTAVPMPGFDYITTLYRSLGTSRVGQLMTEDDVGWVMSRRNYSELTFCSDGRLELSHGLPHMWVGGFMNIIRISPNDPAFYLLHTYIDYLWERFRQTRQSFRQRETDYVEERLVCNAHHGPNDTMRPFAMRNLDGLSNAYTQNWYSYVESPSCRLLPGASNESDCNSEYLFCHRTLRRCVSKVRPGGDCTGLQGMDACWNGRCQGIVCVPMQTDVPIADTPFKGLFVWTKVLLVDKNGGPIVDSKTRVTVKGVNYDALETFRPESGALQYPEHAGLAYVRLPRPLLSSQDRRETRAAVSVVDRFDRPCQAYCFYGDADYRPCNGSLTITPYAETSDPVSFTHSRRARRFLNTDLTGHPSLWNAGPPFLNFFCGYDSGTSDVTRAFDFLPQIAKQNFNSSEYVWFQVLVLNASAPFVLSVTDLVVVEASNPSNASDYYRTHTHSRQLHNNRDIGQSAFPYPPGMVFVRARNPFHRADGISAVTLFALRPRAGVYCRSKCATRGDGETSSLRVRDCSNAIELKVTRGDVATMPNFAFDEGGKSFINWNLKGHQTRWKNVLPYFRFYC